MNNIWFGPRGHMQWVPAPAASMESSKVGATNTLNYLNGGARVRRSLAAAKKYVMSWSNAKIADIRPVLDMADGLYGQGAIHFVDPFAADANMLPQQWAFPAQAAYDGIILDNSSTRPTLIPTDSNNYNYPVESAIFNVPSRSPGDAIHEVFVPIPPGYTAHVGAHGKTGTGGLVEVQVATGAATTGATHNMVLLPVTTDTRFNHSVTSEQGIGILIRLGGVGTITLSGLMVQVLPSTTPVPAGGFISGQGHSGLSFVDQPVYTPFSAALGRADLVIELLETEAWRVVPNLGG